MRCLAAPFALSLIPAACAVAQGLPWPFEMQVERPRQLRDGYEVTTTGAVFQVRLQSGEIACAQRIGTARPLGVLRLPEGSLRELRLTRADTARVEFAAADGTKLEIACESVVTLRRARAWRAEVVGLFEPEHIANEQGSTQALDDNGGLNVYLVPSPLTRARVERHEGGFRSFHEVAAEAAFLLSVCPPREYNWQQHATERIVHQFPETEAGSSHSTGRSPRALPTDEELERWREMGNVLVLHLEFWDGFGVRAIKPRDPERFRAVVQKAHELGYLVLPYSSPYYYQPARLPGGALREDAVDLYLQEAEWLLTEYGVDGLYWDGVFDDIPKAWECARRTRELLGSRRLYVHCTTTPLPTTRQHVPFVDTYADYLLRGEGQARAAVDPLYLRYEVSGLGLSNAIGELCYDTCRLEPPVLRNAMEAAVRIPYWPGLQMHGNRAYFLSPSEHRGFVHTYLPATQSADLAEWEPLLQAGRETRAAFVQSLARAREANQARLAEYLAERRQAHAAEAAGNLAAFKPATCSDHAEARWAPHGLGYLPVYATDVNRDTYWASDFPPQWITVDLESVQTISQVRVVTYFADRRFYHYRVEVSVDDETWEQVGEKADDALSTAEGTVHRFGDRQARHVRVVMLHNSANKGQHVAEIEVYR